MNRKNNNITKNVFPYAILLAIIVGTLFLLNLNGVKVNELTAGELLKEMNSNNVTEITITPKSDESIYYVEGKLKDYKENESFKAKLIEGEIANVTEYVADNEIEEYKNESDPGSSSLLYIIVNIIPATIPIGHIHNHDDKKNKKSELKSEEE